VSLYNSLRGPISSGLGKAVRSPCELFEVASSSRQPNIQNINCQRQGRIWSSATSDTFRASCVFESLISCHASHGPGHLFNFAPSLYPLATTKWTTYFQSSFLFPHILHAPLLCLITSMTKVSKSRLKPLRRFPNLNYCCRHPVVNMSWM
jgi:hypothetical protein